MLSSSPMEMKDLAKTRVDQNLGLARRKKKAKRLSKRVLAKRANWKKQRKRLASSRTSSRARRRSTEVCLVGNRS